MLIFLWFLKKKKTASLASQYYKESPVAIEDALTHMVNVIEMHFCFFFFCAGKRYRTIAYHGKLPTISSAK